MTATKPHPPRRYRCRWCKTWVKHTCTWTVERPRRVEVGTINYGDVLCGEGFLMNSRLMPLKFRWKVIDVLALGNRTIRLTVRQTADKNGRRMSGHERGVCMFAEEKVWAMRPVRCGAPCCARHRRHLGPRAYICMNHWRAWETA